jgi:hypothetical protein
LIVHAAIVVSPETANVAAKVLVAHLRASGSYDTGLAALVADLVAVAVSDDNVSGTVTVAADWLTIRQYAALVGISPSGARERARVGRVPARKVDGRWQLLAQPNGRARRS